MEKPPTKRIPYGLADYGNRWELVYRAEWNPAASGMQTEKQQGGTQ
jgi:hypothetical protein